MTEQQPHNFAHDRDYAAAWQASEDRTPLFTVTKREPNAGLALKYPKRARRTDPDQAMSWLIEAAVGEQGYDDLVIELANPDVDNPMQVLQGLVARIQKVALGGLEAPKAPTS